MKNLTYGLVAFCLLLIGASVTLAQTTNAPAGWTPGITLSTNQPGGFTNGSYGTTNRPGGFTNTIGLTTNAPGTITNLAGLNGDTNNQNPNLWAFFTGAGTTYYFYNTNLPAGTVVVSNNIIYIGTGGTVTNLAFSNFSGFSGHTLSLNTNISQFYNDAGYISNISGQSLASANNDAGFLTSAGALNFDSGLITSDSGNITAVGYFEGDGQMASQGWVTGQGFLTDAPSDGNPYARLNGSWNIVSGGGGSSTNIQAANSSTPGTAGGIVFTTGTNTYDFDNGGPIVTAGASIAMSGAPEDGVSPIILSTGTWHENPNGGSGYWTGSVISMGMDLNITAANSDSSDYTAGGNIHISSGVAGYGAGTDVYITSQGNGNLNLDGVLVDVSGNITATSFNFADNSSGFNWVGTPPANTTDALNRITAKVVSLSGNPIP